MPFGIPRKSLRLPSLLLIICSSLYLGFYYRNSGFPYLLNDQGIDQINIRPNEQFSTRLATFLEQLKQAKPHSSTLKSDDSVKADVAIEGLVPGVLRRNTTLLSHEDFEASKKAHEAVVSLIPDFEDLVRYKPHYKGIVTVGGEAYTPAVLVSILMLRRTHSTLPVEMFLPNQNLYDFHTCEIVFKELNARCVVLPTFPNFEIARYQYKIFAILLSSFEDVIFLDADSFPVVDPASIFTQKPYTNTGLITWPDFWVCSSSYLYYDLSNQATPSMLEQGSTDAGQLVISKREHARSILLTIYYNLYGPEFFYLLLSQEAAGQGDKETWVAAARALGKTRYQVRETASAVGHAGKTGEYRFMGAIQYHPFEDYKAQLKNATAFRISENRKPVFLHHIGTKLNPANLLSFDGVRMWGPRNLTIQRFGHDLEADAWNAIIRVACHFMAGFGICETLKDNWNNILSAESQNEAS